jgi:hypothetical protein
MASLIEFRNNLRKDCWENKYGVLSVCAGLFAVLIVSGFLPRSLGRTFQQQLVNFSFGCLMPTVGTMLLFGLLICGLLFGVNSFRSKEPRKIYPALGIIICLSLLLWLIFLFGYVIRPPNCD